MQISDTEFENLINEAMDELPEGYIQRLKNVAITYEDEPTPEQLQKLKIRGGTLLGLYEGIPPVKRSGNYSMVLPDKITLFKNSIIRYSRDLKDLKAQVKNTLWHEIAHHYGLDHDRIHELENGKS